MGAAELRNGNLSGRARTANGLTNSMRAMTVSMLLDYIAILTDANAAQNDDLTLNLTVTDENEQFYVTRKNGVLLTYPGENRPDAQASVTCRRLQLFALMTGQQAGQVQITGDATVLKRLLAYASKFEKDLQCDRTVKLTLLFSFASKTRAFDSRVCQEDWHCQPSFLCCFCLTARIVVFRAFSLIARPLFLPRRGLPPWANRAIAEYDRAVHVILA